MREKYVKWHVAFIVKTIFMRPWRYFSFPNDMHKCKKIFLILDECSSYVKLGQRTSSLKSYHHTICITPRGLFKDQFVIRHKTYLKVGKKKKRSLLLRYFLSLLSLENICRKSPHLLLCMIFLVLMVTHIHSHTHTHTFH